MISRDNLSTGKIGTYSELIVAAAFLAEGFEVTMPFGNQRAWDLLVAKRDDCNTWQRVQVKTLKETRLRSFPYIQLNKRSKSQRRSSGKTSGIGYAAEDVDWLVVLYPETGALWRLPASAFCGKFVVRLSEDFLWRGAIEQTATPLVHTCKPFQVLRRESIRDQRSALRSLLPAERPADVSENSWVAVTRWCNGFGYKPIAGELGISEAAVSERVRRGLSRMGLVRLPEGYKRSHGKTAAGAVTLASPA